MATPDERQRVGRRIATLRVQRGLSQKDLADRAMIHQITLSRIEHGHRGPHNLTLQSIALALGVTMDDIKGGDCDRVE